MLLINYPAKKETLEKHRRCVGAKITSYVKNTKYCNYQNYVIKTPVSQ